MGLGYQLDPAYILQHAGELAWGLIWTVVLTAIGVAGGIALGTAGGLARAYRIRVLSPAIAGLVAFIRTTPLFVQIFFLYFGLPELGLQLPPLSVACIALVLWGAAYNTENVRASLEALGPGYGDAARAIGLPEGLACRLVLLPIAFRFAMPSITNTSIETLKGSSLMLAISFPELTDVTINLMSVSFRIFELFFVLGSSYLVLSALLSRAMRGVERRLAWPG